MKRSLLCLSAMVVSGSLALSTCSGSSGSTTLKLVAADYGDEASNSSKIYWDGVASAFTAAHPNIKVNVQVVNWNTIDNQVATMIQSGNVPDILQTGGYADKAADDLLYKVEDVMSIRARGHLIPSFSQAGEVKGVQYGIPFVSSTRALVYNKAIFAKAGITRPPTTWEELRQDAEKIKAEVKDVTAYALPLGPEEAEGESMIWELGNGGGYTDLASNYTLDSKANIATFTWLKDNLVGPGLTYPNPAATNRKTAFAGFAAGKVAMLNGHPSLIQMAEHGKVDYGVAPIPGKDGPLDSTLGVADWMMAFKKNGHRDAIKAFLDFAYSEKNTLKFDELYNLMPVTKDTRYVMQSSGKHKDLGPFFDLLPGAVFYPLGDRSWDAVSAEIKKSGGSAVNSQPAKVLGALQEKADQIKSD
ncbi:extracellular solute-binding protein [Streptomyces sp. NPDC020800]|uniref:extracellular solute-binding protein n=1 Tax=Streptomyces sp. NPDC020800 TaxID=3365092 RepID=UPI0037B32BD6